MNRRIQCFMLSILVPLTMSSNFGHIISNAAVNKVSEAREIKLSDSTSQRNAEKDITKKESGKQIKVLLNGYPFEFYGNPRYDGKNLWLPGSELMVLMNMTEITNSEKYLSGQYCDKNNNWINCHFNVGSQNYYPDTSKEEYLKTKAVPYRKNGETYITLEMFENVFGNKMSFQDNTLKITMKDVDLISYQDNDSKPLQVLRLKGKEELGDTRLNSLIDGMLTTAPKQWYDWIETLKKDGFTRVRATYNFAQGPIVDFKYARAEKKIDQEYRAIYDKLKEEGIKTTYSLNFWDMNYRIKYGYHNYDRLSTEEELDRFVSYVKMVVKTLKGKIDAYELWNEPDANYDFYQRIKAEDYIKMAKKVIPIIKKIDPDAKIVIPSSSSYIYQECQEYTRQILQSDIVKLADVIALHAVNNDASPEFHSDYYYHYDAMWDEIKEMAENSGFTGEYIADELDYRSPHSMSLQPVEGDYHPYDPVIAAKYIGRMIAINRGMDITVGTSGTNSYERRMEGKIIRNMGYLLDGLEADHLPVHVSEEAEKIRYYTFSDKDNNYYVTIWNDSEAKVKDQGTASTITISDCISDSAAVLDPFHSMTQELNIETDGTDIRIDKVMIRDYPVIIKLSGVTYSKANSESEDLIQSNKNSSVKQNNLEKLKKENENIISVYHNGLQLKLENSIIVKDGTVWMPGFEIMEALGAKKLQIRQNDDGVHMVLSGVMDIGKDSFHSFFYTEGCNEMIVDTITDKIITIDTPPCYINGEFMISSELVDYTLKSTSKYDKKKNRIDIDSGETDYRKYSLQKGVEFNAVKLQTLNSKDLEDNRIGTLLSALWQFDDTEQADIINTIVDTGYTHPRITINAIDCDARFDNKAEFKIDPKQDLLFTKLADNSVKNTLILSFWDKEYRKRTGEKLPVPRFKNEKEVERYLEYVRFIVHHFKDRIPYYEIWNEWNIKETVQSIDFEDYIKLVKLTVPVIREECPEAKIVVGSIASGNKKEIYSQEDLYKVINSDIMPLVDVICIEPLFGASPEYAEDTYYHYADFIKDVKQTAEKNGFKGEYFAGPFNLYSSVEQPGADNETYLYSDIRLAKYYARNIVQNLGLNVRVEVSDRPIEIIHGTIQNLCTVMAGAKPSDSSVEVKCKESLIKQYGFSLPNDEQYISLWNDDKAGDTDKEVRADIVITGNTSGKVSVIDPFYGFEQELDITVKKGFIEIKNFIIKDYPLFIKYGG